MSQSGLPIVLTRLQEARCVVVGGGEVGERKVEALIEAGAVPVVVSPALTARLAGWAAEGRIAHAARAYRDGDLDAAFLVVAATDDPEVNREVAQAAERAGALANVVDDPGAGNFHMAAAVRRGDLLLAVSTGGAAPAAAAFVRRKLETLVGDEYAELLALLRELRPRVRQEVAAPRRAAIWRALASDRMLEWLRAGEHERARRYAAEVIAEQRGAA